MTTEADEEYKVLHPDVPRARRRYAQGHKDAFSKGLVEERESLMKQGIEYWNSVWDSVFQRRARKKTGAAIARGEFDWEKAGRPRERRSRPPAPVRITRRSGAA